MANKIELDYQALITAQASAAISAGSDSGGSLTTITNTSAGNGKGADCFKAYCVVTVAPSGGAATACLKYAPSYNSTMTDINFDDGSLTVEIPNGGTGKFYLGDLYSPAQYFQCKLAETGGDYGFTASLVLIPVLPEVQ